MKEPRPFQVWILIQALLLATVLSAGTKKLDDCEGEMDCFSSSACLTSGAILLNQPVGDFKDNCDAVLQIRAYTTKYWLVIMQSLDPAVTSITVKHNNNIDLLSCTSGKASYKSSAKKLINKQAPLLKCEFIVEDRNDILPNPGPTTDILEMKTNIASSKGEANFIAIAIIATCDPRRIKKLKGVALTKANYTIIPVDAKTSKVTCPKEFSLEYDPDGTDNFVKADSIECKANKYVVKTESGEEDIDGEFQARCIILACNKCVYDPTFTTPQTGSPKRFDAEDVDGTTCQILKCDKGQLQSGSAQGIATCKYQKEEGRHMWQLDKEKIDKTTTVECVPPFPCTAKVVEDMCNQATDGSRCTATADKVSCPNDNEILQVNEKSGNVTCDKDTGKYKMDDGAELPADAKLSCIAAPQSVTAAREDSAGEGNIGLTIGLAFAGVLALIAAALFAYNFLVVRKRTAAAAAQPPDAVKVAAPAAAAGAPEAPSSPAAQPPNAPGAGGEPKSLESKSNTSKKGNEAKVEPKEDKPMTNEEIREKAEKMIKEAQQLKDMADGVPEKPGPPPTTLQSTDDATHGGTVMMMDGDKLVPVDMARTTAGPAAPAAKAAPKK